MAAAPNVKSRTRLRLRWPAAFAIPLLSLLVSCGTAPDIRYGSAVDRSEETHRGPPPLPAGHQSSITRSEDSVLLAFASRQWGTAWPPEEFLLRGSKASVDIRLGDSVYVTKRHGNVWQVLGEGLHVREYPGSPYGHGATFYGDRNGIRLIAIEGSHFGSDTIILSTESKHPARLLEQDFRALRTESGIGLGDSPERLLQRLGEPSHRDRFGEYEICWYLGQLELEEHVLPGTDGPAHRSACAAAYALKNHGVVEIWLHVWSPDPHG